MHQRFHKIVIAIRKNLNSYPLLHILHYADLLCLCNYADISISEVCNPKIFPLLRCLKCVRQ